jgi:hypothetical protein
LFEIRFSQWNQPTFNDFVVHNGHAFGFDGSILACIDLKDGITASFTPARPRKKCTSRRLGRKFEHRAEA